MMNAILPNTYDFGMRVCNLAAGFGVSYALLHKEPFYYLPNLGLQ